MKKIKLNLYTIIFLFLTVGIYGQLQNANWYFGDHAGLTFNTEPPTALTNGQTSNYAITNSVTVSNEYGELLFYTNGHYVWNKNQDVMVGSIDEYPENDLGVVLAIPFPGNDNKYFIFYNNAEGGFYSGEYVYSIINMEGNNGLGEVEVLNESLGIPLTNIHDTKTANVIMHSDGESYWLVLLSEINSKFYSIKIDSNGISNTPIISNSTGLLKQYMSVSPDQTKLAYTSIDYTLGGGKYEEGMINICVHNFNNSTGEISLFYYNFSESDLDGKAPSVEFSENGEFLYIINSSNDDYYRELLQYKVESIENGPYTVYSTHSPSGNLEFGNETIIKRGINEKIYVPGITGYPINTLSVINNPNEFGNACNFIENQIDLLTGYSIKLPQQVPVHDSCLNDLYIDEDVQSGEFDIQQASNSITAVNTIFSGATAKYNAGNFVLLDVGFNAKDGSDFYAFIDDCYIYPIKDDKRMASKPSNNFETNSNNLESQLVIYPNPNNGLFTIDFPFKDNLIYKVEIYDSNFQIRANKNVNRLNNQIEISNLTEGFYHLKLFTDVGVIIKHFVIEN